MAGDWIKMRNDLADDPAVIAIAAAVGLDEYAVVGRLHTLWAWADEQSRDGHAVGVTATWLDRKVQCDGFASALATACWLEVSTNGLSIPNFENHNGATAKTRALATRRQQRHRAVAAVDPGVTITSANGHAIGVTKARPEKRREEKKKESSTKTLWSRPEWVPAKEWNDFEAMRKATPRVPFTDAARNGVIHELEKLRSQGLSPADLLRAAVTNGWRTVYAPKHANGSGVNRQLAIEAENRRVGQEWLAQQGDL